jgi:hypothetical protein
MKNNIFRVLPGEHRPELVVPGAPAWNKGGNKLCVMYRLPNQSGVQWSEVRFDEINVENALRAASYQEAARLSQISGTQVTLQDMCVHMELEIEMENGRVVKVRAITTEEIRVAHKFAIRSTQIDSYVAGALQLVEGMAVEVFGVQVATISEEEANITVFSTREVSYEWEYDLRTKQGRVQHAEKFLQHIASNISSSDIKMGNAHIGKKDASGYSAWVANKALEEFRNAHKPRVRRALL